MAQQSAIDKFNARMKRFQDSQQNNVPKKPNDSVDVSSTQKEEKEIVTVKTSGKSRLL